MSSKVVIGIDPGATGAIAEIRNGTLTRVWDMPTNTRKAGGEEVWGGGVQAIVNAIKETPAIAIIVGLEQVSAMPGQGVSSMFRFGESYGAVRAVMEANLLAVERFSSQAWKKSMGLIGCEKDDSRTKAIGLFPTMADSLKRKKDSGRAEAALIGLYLYRMRFGS